MGKKCDLSDFDRGMIVGVTKCKVLHVGNKNIRQDYFMGGPKLESAQCLSGSSQYAVAVKKVNCMLSHT